MVMRHLYRSDDAIIGGICAGIADYLGLDAVLIRVVALVILIAGMGSPIVVYLVLWFIIPKQPQDFTAYVDVEPEEAKPSPKCRPAAAAPIPPAGVKPCPDGMSPEECAQVQYRAAAASSAGGADSVDAAGFTSRITADVRPDDDCAPGAGYAASYARSFDPGASASQASPRAATSSGGPSHEVPVSRGVVFLGVLLVAVGIVALFERTISSVSWWSFWPIIIIMAGFYRMVRVTPLKPWDISQFTSGIGIVLVGVFLLLCSIGRLPWSYISCVVALWPLIVVALGFSILGSALGSTAWQILSDVLFIAVLLLGFDNCVNETSLFTASFTGSSSGHVVNVDGQERATTNDLDSYAYSNLIVNSGGSAFDVVAADENEAHLTGSSGLLDGVSLKMSDTATSVPTIEIDSGMMSFASSYALTLPKSVQWQSVTVNAGASSTMLNLTDLVVNSLKVNAGASVTSVTLGQPAPNGSEATITTGASQVTLVIPRGVSAIIISNGLDAITTDEGFGSVDDETQRIWTTQGYADAISAGDSVWTINLSGGLGVLRLTQSDT